MKIGSFESKPVTPAATAERKGTAQAAPAAGHGVQASAQVELSSTATQLVKGAEDGSFDSAKVERIAAAIRDGTYRIDANAIADKLIVNAEELLGRKLGN